MRNGQAQVDAVDQQEAGLFVGVADELQGSDHRELGVDEIGTQDAEVVKADAGAHPVGGLGVFVAFGRPDDAGDMCSVFTDWLRRRVREFDEFLDQVPAHRDALDGTFRDLGELRVGVIGQGAACLFDAREILFAHQFRCCCRG